MSLDPRQRPQVAIEVKWTDAPMQDQRLIRPLLSFLGPHQAVRALVTTCTGMEVRRIDGHEVEFVPAALHCYSVGKRTLERRLQR